MDITTLESPEKLYDLILKDPNYKKLVNTCPIIGIYDDHDLGGDEFC